MAKQAMVGLLLGVACGDDGGAGPGQEGGPCLDGACLGDLVCLSNACVAPLGSTSSDPPTTDNQTTPTTTGPNPSGDPTQSPTNSPSGDPSSDPSGDPSGDPTADPSGDPSDPSATTVTTRTTNTTDTTGGVSASDTSTSDDPPPDTEDFPAFCGDGNVDPGEACDLGPANADTGACKTDCTVAACGDGYKGPGEACDDGNNNNGDGCNGDCAVANKLQWVRILDGSKPNGIDTGEAVTVDGADNIIVGGRAAAVLHTIPYLAKLSPAGTPLWEKYFAGSLLSGQVQSVAVDAEDIIYAVGREILQDNSSRSFLHAYAPDGAEKWTVKYAPPGDIVALNGVVVAANGDLITAGDYAVGDSSKGDIWLRRWTKTGDKIWDVYYDNPDAKKYDQAYDMALAANGDILVAGRSLTVANKTDYVTLRFTNDGVLKWSRFFDHMSKFDIAQGVAVDPQGNVVVTGYTEGVINAIGYKADGAPNWTYKSSLTSWAAAYDAAGHAYICGYNGDDLWLQTLAPDGTPAWSYAYDSGDMKNNEQAFDIVLDSHGNVIMTGQVTLNTNVSIIVLKFAPP